MGMEASACIEYWDKGSSPDGTTRFTYWGEYHVPNRGVALQLYALTGIGGGDPSYDINDLSWLGSKLYERDQDVAASKPIKIEAADVASAIQRLKAPRTIHLSLKAALDTVTSLGPHARLVFWMTI